MICLSKHKDGPEILVEYLGRTLDAARTAELDEHIAECVECQGLVGAWNTLDEWKAPAVSPDFDAKLYARIAGESRAPWWKRAFRLEGWFDGGWWKPAIPIAAGCAVLVIALSIRGPEPMVVPDTKALVFGTEPINIEQVEQALEDLDLLVPRAEL